MPIAEYRNDVSQVSGPDFAVTSRQLEPQEKMTDQNGKSTEQQNVAPATAVASNVCFSFSFFLSVFFAGFFSEMFILSDFFFCVFSLLFVIFLYFLDGNLPLFFSLFRTVFAGLTPNFVEKSTTA